MKKWYKIGGVILCLFLTITGGGCKKQTAKKATAQPRKQVVTDQGVEAYGIIKARDYKDINLDFPAQIIRVPVKDGQHVKLGETLIELNINDYLAMINSKENELHEARFELLRKEKDLRDARETYARGARYLADKESLCREGAISSQELDDYKDQLLEKKKAVTDIQLGVGQESQKGELAVLREKVTVLEYDLARMRNKLNQSFFKGNLIVSDYSNAVVSDVKCAAGYSVGVSEKQEKLLSIMNLDSLYISADVPEEFIKDVRVGAAATIIPVADHGRKYRGYVLRIADIAVKQDGETNVAVEISLDSKDAFLKPNFNVDVEISKPGKDIK